MNSEECIIAGSLTGLILSWVVISMRSWFEDRSEFLAFWKALIPILTIAGTMAVCSVVCWLIWG